MNSPATIETRVYAGPNLLSEHPVVSLIIPGSFDTPVQTSMVDTLLGSIFPGNFIRSICSQGDKLTCAELTAALTEAFLAASGTPELSVNLLDDVEHQSVIVARYYDPFASLTALQASITVARQLSKSGETLLNSGRQITAFVTQKIDQLAYYAPDFFAHSLIRMAEIKNIPVRVFASASRVWLFGHGAASVQFFEAATSYDGLPGARLSSNKAYTNQIVTSLGFPTARWGLASDLVSGKNIAKNIGYPVVIKPVNGSKGRGVTANITDEAEFEEAFRKAAAVPTASVLVENYVAGNDYRISVFGGRFGMAARRKPAEVVGNGKLSVQELINQENASRELTREVQFDLKSILVDAELLRVLRKQGFSLDDVPPENTCVQLRSVANIATGGSLEVCTTIIHPDNVAMAECIARSFRLDAVGIDLIIPDIRNSWRESTCAIIEINATPGFSSDTNGMIILERKFVRVPDGRIPIILALNCEKPIHDHLVTELGSNCEGLGYVTIDTCKLGGHSRGESLIHTRDKVNALLSDPACSVLVIGLTTSDIEIEGLPVDRCAVSIYSKHTALPEQVKNILKVASGQLIEISDIDDFEQERFKNILSKLKEASVF